MGYKKEEKMIEEYRKKIDEIDEQLIRLLEERLDISVKIGEYKIENNLDVFDEKREKIVVEKNISRVENEDYRDLAEDFIKNLMDVSKKLQRRIHGKER